MPGTRFLDAEASRQYRGVHIQALDGAVGAVVPGCAQTPRGGLGRSAAKGVVHSQPLTSTSVQRLVLAVRAPGHTLCQSLQVSSQTDGHNCGGGYTGWELGRVES